MKLADGKERLIRHMSTTTYWSPDGKPMFERLYGELPNLFKDEDQLRELWGRPDTRKALLESLAERGFGETQLREMACRRASCSRGGAWREKAGTSRQR